MKKLQEGGLMGMRGLFNLISGQERTVIMYLLYLHLLFSDRVPLGRENAIIYEPEVRSSSTATGSLVAIKLNRVSSVSSSMR